MTLPIQYMDGTGDQPLILLHGLGTDYQSWRYVREHIDTSLFRVYIPDLLGFGEAPKPRDIEYTLSDHADAVIETIHSLGLSEVMLAGHSMGALVAIEVAMKQPELASHLTLLGVPLYEKIPERSSKLRRLTRAEGVYFTIFSFLKDNPDLVISGSNVAEELLPLLHGMEINKDTWNAFEHSLVNGVMQTKSFRDVANLQVPTTIICGLLDIFVSNKIVKKAAASNEEYVRVQKILGPHEITPRQGKAVARTIRRAAYRYSTYL